jgi:Transglycosylase SLT domain
MNRPLNAFQVISVSTILLLCAGGGFGHGKRSKKKTAKSSEVPAAESTPSAVADGQIQLKLIDGTRVPVDEAWESAQGIWYRRNGMTHLVPRERVKSIERGSNAKVNVEGGSNAKVNLEPQGAGVIKTIPVQSDPADRPAWIYLVGGARVEADSAAESTAGVWYKRGPFTIFIERSRIDRIEREDPETLAKSDSGSKKERGWSTGNPKIDNLIRSSGAKYGVDPYLIFCVMEQESHFNTHALSPKGASGLMQLMPGTSARFGVRRPNDPAQNIAGGTRYLKQLIDQFKGHVDLVLASYNAGEGAVIRFGHKVPPYRETRDYVKRISYRYRRGKAPLSQSSNGANGPGRT